MQFQCSECMHKFEVSRSRLLFTRRFRGENPMPTTVAYYLRCPKCDMKSWLVPVNGNAG